ncbi:MAG: hypothetical protein A4E57_02443 [Syntrophorhabdaceae bacterium PtaU1.Bin034]|nr:MAG: hypothetical protein A4E57_02443 [Syntrophorhabdaceae bacterium PtaU1.Bin034]
MQDSLINLLNSFSAGPKALSIGLGGGSGPESNGFAVILGAVLTAASAELAGKKPMICDNPFPLLPDDLPTLFPALFGALPEAAVEEPGLTEKTINKTVDIYTGTVSDNSDKQPKVRIDISSEKAIESLLLGIVALFEAQDKGAGTEPQSGDKRSFVDTDRFSPAESGQDPDDESGLGHDRHVDGSDFQDTGILQMIALVVFKSLQSVQQQTASPETTDTSGTEIGLPPKNQQEIVVASKETIVASAELKQPGVSEPITHDQASRTPVTTRPGEVKDLFQTILPTQDKTALSSDESRPAYVKMAWVFGKDGLVTSSKTVQTASPETTDTSGTEIGLPPKNQQEIVVASKETIVASAELKQPGVSEPITHDQASRTPVTTRPGEVKDLFQTILPTQAEIESLSDFRKSPAVEAMSTFTKEAPGGDDIASATPKVASRTAFPDPFVSGTATQVDMTKATGNEGGVTNSKDTSSAAFVEGRSRLIESADKLQFQSEAKEKDQHQPPQKENYQIVFEKNAGIKDSGQEHSTRVFGGRPSAAAAIEKLEKIVEQYTGRTGHNEMTVRLNIGNEESLVLGLKDLGQSISVEVKASHQGIVTLLESEKAAIMRHLEGKDIHANILVDPNASGTWEKRDRRESRESRQRLLASRLPEETDFSELLEVFV